MLAGYRGRPTTAYQGQAALQDPYRKPLLGGGRKCFTLGHHNGGAGGSLSLYPGPSNRARNFSGDPRSAVDYASDTEAVQSPPRSLRNGRLRSTTHSRSNSLPRTFNREALLRHPELSMEIDRLSDTMSDLGERLSVASVSARLSTRGARSPSSFSTISQVRQSPILTILDNPTKTISL